MEWKGGGGERLADTNWPKNYTFTFFLSCPTFVPKHGNLERTNSPFSSSL